MLLNEHQIRLLGYMLNLIEQFREGECSFYDLVYGLEGALDAGEFHNELFVREWYDYWTPLEILDATCGNNAAIKDANECICEMDFFLKRVLNMISIE